MIEVYWGATTTVNLTLTTPGGGAPYTSDDVFFTVSHVNGGSPLLYMTETGAEDGAREGMGQPNPDGLCTISFSRASFSTLTPGDYLCTVCGGGTLGSGIVIAGPMLLRVLPSSLGGR